LGFRQLSDGVVPQVVKSKASRGALYIMNIFLALHIAADFSWALQELACRAFYSARKVAPRRSPALLSFIGIDVAVFATWKNKMVRF
jgi:hypothetical protein